MKLLLIRHGETVENKLRILQGHLPGSLTPVGVQQIEDTAQRLKSRGEYFYGIVTSDLHRAVQTAEIIEKNLQVGTHGLLANPMVKTPLLRERDWGEYTGMEIDEARDRFYHDGRWTFTGFYETEKMLYQRGRDVLDYFRTNYPADATILVVSHGQLLRFVLAARFACQRQEVANFINGEVREISL